jgi:hypothetical protein
VVKELPDGPEIAVYVQDHAIGQSYHIPVQPGLVRHDVAELLVDEIRSRRAQAGVESWQLCLP